MVRLVTGEIAAMTPQEAKRVARLAIQRFGVDPRRVKELLSKFAQTLKEGGDADLLSSLLIARLLTAEQADQLRHSLAKTRMAPPAKAVVGGTKPADSTEPTTEIHIALKPAPTTVGGYRVLRKLGEGGMGEVYLVQDDHNGQKVAMKILALQLAANPSFVERFHREARHAAMLNHVNIAGGYGSGFDPKAGCHFLLMECIDGPSAQQLLDQFGPLPVRDAVRITLDITHALEHAHSRNIIHRDIKPENILITPAGVAKLADLGLAKDINQKNNNLTKTRQSFGTPYYMAYEQSISAKSADVRSDIFSLGASLYHMLTGRVPFEGETPLEVLERKELGIFTPASVLHPEVPEELDRILATMMARDPKDRYQTASDVIVALERLGLASPVLSIADRQQALEDPVVRARMAASPQVTLPDPDSSPLVRREGMAGLWYLRCQTDTGRDRYFIGTTTQVILNLRRGQISPESMASNSQQGPYQPLLEIPEFQKALQPPPDEPELPKRLKWKLWLLVGVWWVVALLLVVRLLFFS
jgi:serine/threonine-protein kinase